LERVEQLLAQYHQHTAAEIAAAFQTALAEFVGDTMPYDDITVVVVKRE
jgi:serine phosphatase RsbU (regulator of sigma subunit)